MWGYQFTIHSSRGTAFHVSLFSPFSLMEFDHMSPGSVERNQNSTHHITDGSIIRGIGGQWKLPQHVLENIWTCMQVFNDPHNKENSTIFHILSIPLMRS